MDYWYIGKDGKRVLARDLEDERDRLRELLRSIINEYDNPDNGRSLRWEIEAAKEALK